MKAHEIPDLTPREEAAARALHETESVIHDYRIAWEDIGPYRRYGYALKVRSIISALDTYDARGPEDTSGGSTS